MKKYIVLMSVLTLLGNKKDYYCDIKGYVKSPGVYKISENDTIQNVITYAGGLKKNANTNNINLSKKVKDEMVIYIYSNEEIKNIESINSCKCEDIYKYVDCTKYNSTTTTETTTTKPIIISTTQTTTTKPVTTEKNSTKTIEIITTSPINIETTTKIIEEKKININNATIEQLVELKGLGEAKAKRVIEYREINGLFINIEDIMNVSGIGQSTFDNIKEFIEV